MFFIIKISKRVIKYSINKVISIYTNLITIIANFKYLHLFFYIYFNKIDVFLIGNGAIGHYPINLFLCKQLYKKDSIFSFKSGVEFANDYLKDKIKNNFHFDQRFENVYQIMESISSLSGGLYKFNKFPEQMQMGNKINFGKLFDGKTTLFEFNETENLEGNLYLDKLGVDSSRYVCLLVRNQEYYSDKGFKDIEMGKRKFRDVDPLGYVPAIQYLVNSGHHVIRMGKGFTEKFPFSHSRFTDYAISEEREDFLDIWLSAHCKFFLSSFSGIGGLPVVFNTPCVFANSFPIGRMQSWAPKTIHIPRVALQNGKVLNIRNMVEMDIIGLVDGEYYNRMGVEVLENEGDDILEAVKEMEVKIESGFSVSELNMNFWKNMKKEWHSGIHTRFSGNGIRTFDYFHKINGINTNIPDSYLKKHADVFLNYS